jgi:GNAT superfamily N-acetyltransferase
MASIELRVPSRDDVPLIHDLVQRAKVADGDPTAMPVQELEELFSSTTTEPDRDLRLAFTGGEPAGWVHVWHLPAGERLERAYLHGTVAPDHRGEGVGSALFDWGVERATARLREADPALPKFVRAEAFDWLSEAHSLFADHGMAPVRWFQDMVRPLTDLPPYVAVDGVEVVPWDRTRDEELRIVRNTSFADHWGTSPTGPEGWVEWMEGYGARPDLSFMALADDRVVGLSFNEHYPEDQAVTGRIDGWLQSIGTLREWRGRGVASALIVRSLERFAAEGFTHACLGVDADSPSGAPHLYAGLGFEPQHRWVTYELAV